MHKKEECFCLFDSCLSSNGEEKQLIINSPEERKKLSRKDIKISLRHNKQQSIQSYISMRNNRSAQRNNSSKMELLVECTKENRIASTNRSFNSPCQRKTGENLPLNGMLIKTAPNHGSGQHTKLICMVDSKMKSSREAELYKTTKIGQNLKESINLSQLMQLELQETKIFKKSKFITHLQSFKESVVSINNETEPLGQKLEESMIMVDYFHPAQEKVLEIEKYLINRK